MPEASTANMLVFRDARERVSAKRLVLQLEQALATLEACCTEDAVLSALLRAGELECALCDTGSADAAALAALSDELAAGACRADPGSGFSIRTCRQLLASVHFEGELTVSRHEGFAYYALHPLDFADLVSSANLRAPAAYVIGIRSIGTTLSAVVTAKLNSTGIPVSRTTVRPGGHPYDRQSAFTSSQREAIMQVDSRGAIFLVCDEGPGRSGSSLLSVAEALENEGVSRDRILLLCSHQPDVATLCAPRAAERWQRYRSVASGMTKRLPQEADDYIGGGDWRRFFIPAEEPWPAAWPQMERLKFVSRDRHSLFKFEGHGHYGEPVRDRELLLTASGFGARYLGQEAGFGLHEFIGGKQVGVENPSLALLRHLANYCAWRAATLPATVSQDNIGQLEHMAAFNPEQEFGFAPTVHLVVQRPVVCDGRMQPCKWREVNGGWIKLDASTHGDDHFFPGPTDIAWDLAGVCVEWQLGADERDFFLAEYRRISGDNPAPRLQEFVVAYAAFRLGWSRMAAASVTGTADENRLLRGAALYRAALNQRLPANSIAC